MSHPKGEIPSFKKRIEYGKKQTPNGLVCKNLQAKKQDPNKSSFLTTYNPELKHSFKQQVKCGETATSGLITGNLRKKGQGESKSSFFPYQPKLKSLDVPKVDSDESLSVDDLLAEIDGAEDNEKDVKTGTLREKTIDELMALLDKSEDFFEQVLNETEAASDDKKNDKADSLVDLDDLDKLLEEIVVEEPTLKEKNKPLTEKDARDQNSENATSTAVKSLSDEDIAEMEALIFADTDLEENPTSERDQAKLKDNLIGGKMRVMDSTDTMNTERLSKNDNTKEDSSNDTEDEALEEILRRPVKNAWGVETIKKPRPKRRLPVDKRLRRDSEEGIDESVFEDLHQTLMGNIDASFSIGSFASGISSDEESLNEYPQENHDILFTDIQTYPEIKTKITKIWSSNPNVKQVSICEKLNNDQLRDIERSRVNSIRYPVDEKPSIEEPRRIRTAWGERPQSLERPKRKKTIEEIKESIKAGKTFEITYFPKLEPVVDEIYPTAPFEHGSHDVSNLNTRDLYPQAPIKFYYSSTIDTNLTFPLPESPIESPNFLEVDLEEQPASSTFYTPSALTKSNLESTTGTKPKTAENAAIMTAKGKINRPKRLVKFNEMNETTEMMEQEIFDNCSDLFAENETKLKVSPVKADSAQKIIEVSVDSKASDDGLKISATKSLNESNYPVYRSLSDTYLLKKREKPPKELLKQEFKQNSKEKVKKSTEECQAVPDTNETSKTPEEKVKKSTEECQAVPDANETSKTPEEKDKIEISKQVIEKCNLQQTEPNAFNNHIELSAITIPNYIPDEQEVWPLYGMGMSRSESQFSPFRTNNCREKPLTYINETSLSDYEISPFEPAVSKQNKKAVADDWKAFIPEADDQQERPGTYIIKRKLSDSDITPIESDVEEDVVDERKASVDKPDLKEKKNKKKNKKNKKKNKKKKKSFFKMFTSKKASISKVELKSTKEKELEAPNKSKKDEQEAWPLYGMGMSRSESQFSPFRTNNCREKPLTYINETSLSDSEISPFEPAVSKQNKKAVADDWKAFIPEVDDHQERPGTYIIKRKLSDSDITPIESDVEEDVVDDQKASVDKPDLKEKKKKSFFKIFSFKKASISKAELKSTKEKELEAPNKSKKDQQERPGTYIIKRKLSDSDITPFESDVEDVVDERKASVDKPDLKEKNKKSLFKMSTSKELSISEVEEKDFKENELEAPKKPKKKPAQRFLSRISKLFSSSTKKSK